jgi:hypothetical protein
LCDLSGFRRKRHKFGEEGGKGFNEAGFNRVQSHFGIGSLVFQFYLKIEFKLNFQGINLCQPNCKPKPHLTNLIIDIHIYWAFGSKKAIGLEKWKL